MANLTYSGYDIDNVISLDARRRTGGTPPGGGEMEARVKALEDKFWSMDGKLDRLLDKVGSIETKIDGLETRVGSIEIDVARLDGKVSTLPTALQLLGFVLAVLAIAGLAKYFAP